MRYDTLTEACAPVLMELATFRRNAATTGLSLQALQNGLRSQLDRVRAECERDPRLAPMIARAFYSLVATADQVVLSSNWQQRTVWAMNLLETSYFGSAKGGTEFFRFAEEIKREPTDEAAEIAELLFHCMAMGFQGELRGERRELESRRQELFDKARLGDGADRGEGGARKLTPDSYGRNSSRTSVKLPTASTLRLATIAVVAAAFAWAFGRVAAQIEVSGDKKAIDEIVQDLEGARKG
ncbi:MAG: DotU family type IV/VI secretion system protein [Planctomycetota bacterium]